jgi:ribosome-associated protein YbcJ (S4-like RNA binding protein)
MSFHNSLNIHHSGGEAAQSILDALCKVTVDGLKELE